MWHKTKHPKSVVPVVGEMLLISDSSVGWGVELR